MYVGPFTQATLMYESDNVSPKVVATPGTLLDYVAKNLSHLLPLIDKAGKLPFYTAKDRRYTFFVPKTLPIDFPSLDPNTCLQILNMATVRGVITTSMLSNNMVVFPLGYPNNLNIKKFIDGQITVGGRTILEGDIFCENGIIHILDCILWPTYFT
jgi:hypothetical protein